MNIYLAARFSKQDEMRLVRQQLEERDGHRVTARWLDEVPYPAPEDQIPIHVMRQYAEYDLEDIENADAIVCFTEPARTGPTRGGRHVEFGYALALCRHIYVVGPVENIFYSLPQVKHYKTWTGARRAINAEDSRMKSAVPEWAKTPPVVFA